MKFSIDCYDSTNAILGFYFCKQGRICGDEQNLPSIVTLLPEELICADILDAKNTRYAFKFPYLLGTYK